MKRGLILAVSALVLATPAAAALPVFPAGSSVGEGVPRRWILRQ